MKFGRILWMIVIIVVLALLLPAYGYSTQAKGDRGVTITLTASKAGATDSSPQYSIEFSVAGKITYFEYIGSWWGNLVKPGEAVFDWPRIGIEVDFRGALPTQVSDSDWGRTTHEYAYGYEYGQDFKITYMYNANLGDTVTAFIRVYDGWGVATGLQKEYVVG